MFEWRNDILWYKGRIYLNSNSKFKVKVMKESHDSPAVGHAGFFKSFFFNKRGYVILKSSVKKLLNKEMHYNIHP